MISAFFINGLATMGLSFLLFFIFANLDEDENPIRRFFGILGVFMLARGVLFLIWDLSLIYPSGKDFIIVDTIFIGAIAALVISILYYLTSSRINFYLMILFNILLVAITISRISFFMYTGLASALVMLISFGEAGFSRKPFLRKAGIFGMSYSILSGSLLLLQENTDIPFYALGWMPPLLLGTSVLFIYLHSKRNIPLPRIPNNKSILANMIKAIIVIISFIVFLGITTLAVHELGHVIFSKIAGCEEVSATIYDDLSNPHFQGVCKNKETYNFIGLGGIITTTVMGLFLFFSRSRVLKNAASAIIGFGMISAYQDIIEIKFSASFSFLITILGLFIFIYSLYSISKFELEEHVKSRLNNKGSFFLDKRTRKKKSRTLNRTNNPEKKPAKNRYKANNRKIGKRREQKGGVKR